MKTFKSKGDKITNRGDGISLVDPNNRLDVFLALLEEARFQRQILQQKSASMNARSSILIATSGVILGLNVTSSEIEIFIPSLMSATIASIFGLAAQFPKYGEEVGIENLEEQLLPLDEPTAVRVHAHRTIKILKGDESSLKRQATQVRLGYVFIAISITLSFFAFVLIAWKGVNPNV
jgi:hypothetical protein